MKEIKEEKDVKEEKEEAIKDEHELIYIRKLFAKNLKKLRNDRQLSQMELASAADLSPNFINEIENEKKWPSIETLAKLVKVLSVEPFLFFIPETMIKISNVDLLKAELNMLIAAIIDEKIECYTNGSPVALEPDQG